MVEGINGINVQNTQVNEQWWYGILFFIQHISILCQIDTLCFFKYKQDTLRRVAFVKKREQKTVPMYLVFKTGCSLVLVFPKVNTRMMQKVNAKYNEKMV